MHRADVERIERGNIVSRVAGGIFPRRSPLLPPLPLLIPPSTIERYRGITSTLNSDSALARWARVDGDSWR